MAPSTDLTNNLTANPDFSQVELDALQLELNTRFALRFPEKRPFFVEGTEGFRTPIEAVFTRSIVEPAAAAKVTGRAGGTWFGLLMARDARPGLLIATNQTSTVVELPGEADAFVGRVRHDLGRSSSIGALTTVRTGRDYESVTGGVDAYVRAAQGLVLAGQALVSQAALPDMEALGGRSLDPSGAAVSGQIDYRIGNLRANVSSYTHTPDFRADLGFIGQVDTRGGAMELNYVLPRPQASRWSEYALSTGSWYWETSSGAPESKGWWMALQARGPRQLWITLNPWIGREAFGDLTYPVLMGRLSLSAAPSSRLSGSLDVEYGRAIDFLAAASARRTLVRPRLTFLAGTHVGVSIGGAYERLRALDGGSEGSAWIAEPTLRVGFSRRSNLRVTTQLRAERRVAGGVSTHRRFAESDALLSYRLPSGTAAFIGVRRASERFRPAVESSPEWSLVTKLTVQLPLFR